MTSTKPLEVNCAWAERSTVSIDPDGQVFPCCYWSTTYYENKYGKKIGLFKMIPQMKEYIERLDDFNCEKKPVTDIIQDPLFNEKLVESFQSLDTLSHPCRIHCSNARPKEHEEAGFYKHGNSIQQKEAGEFVDVDIDKEER